MSYFIAGIGLLVLLYTLAYFFVRANPAQIASGLTRGAGVGAIVLGVILSLRGAAMIGAPIVFFGLGALRSRRGVGMAPPRRSSVETASLRMVLEHDTGVMDGDVLAGPHAGARLSDLDRDTVQAVLAYAVSHDPDAAALLRAYIERRFESEEAADGAAEGPSSQSAGPMTPNEARDILGVGPTATREEIKAAHRRLMMVAHPDRGGSTVLAAKINRAKDVLLGARR